MSDTSITVIYHGMSLTVLYDRISIYMYIPFIVIKH